MQGSIYLLPLFLTRINLADNDQ